MTGRLHEAQDDAAYINLVPVFHGTMRKGGMSVSAEDDLGSGAGGEFAVAADEVGMQVCLDHIFDL